VLVENRRRFEKSEREKVRRRKESRKAREGIAPSRSEKTFTSFLSLFSPQRSSSSAVEPSLVAAEQLRYWTWKRRLRKNEEHAESTKTSAKVKRRPYCFNTTIIGCEERKRSVGGTREGEQQGEKREKKRKGGRTRPLRTPNPSYR
jgi:hypothetical protein